MSIAKKKKLEKDELLSLGDDTPNTKKRKRIMRKEERDLKRVE